MTSDISDISNIRETTNIEEVKKRSLKLCVITKMKTNTMKKNIY